MSAKVTSSCALVLVAGFNTDLFVSAGYKLF